MLVLGQPYLALTEELGGWGLGGVLLGRDSGRLNALVLS